MELSKYIKSESVELNRSAIRLQTTIRENFPMNHVRH